MYGWIAATGRLAIVLAPAVLLSPAVLGSEGLRAQGLPTPDEEVLAGFTWRYVGPAIAGGRVTDVEVVPGRTSHWYVGSASGGVFESVNHGVTWRPVFDEALNLSVGDIALAPSDPLEIWVGTGEANNRNSSPWGAGIFHSSDGGKSWRFRGLAETRHIGKIVVHPTDPRTVWVAAVGHLWGPNRERGVYKTTDGGERWDKVLYIDENTGVIDLAVHPADPDVLYAATYPRRRRAWGFVGGGPTGGIHRRDDGGESWTRLESGLPEGDVGRVGFETWSRRPDVIMAIVEAEDGGVFRSDDRGESWRRLNELNPRPMYYSQVRVDPNDDDRVYVLGTNLHRSTDGGATFETMPMEVEYNTGVHVDHHDLWIDPADSRHMVLGNDGGLYYTFDRGESWEFTGNLPIQQLYDISVNMEDPYRIVGGLQDNNHYIGPSATRRYHGILNHDWRVVDYGDGMTSQADPTDPNTIYVSSQGGAILRVDTRTLDRKDLQPFNPDTANAFRFYWTAPIHLSPHDPSTVYLGGNRLFISRDRGGRWEMTDDLTKALDRDSLEIMGMITDSTTLSRNDGVSGYGTLTTISESPAQAGVIWVGADDGSVQVSRDGGASWIEVSGNVPDLPAPMFVSRVEASAAVPGRAYLAFDGHWDDDYRPYLYVTEDFGASWRSLTGDLESTTVNAVREHPGNPDLLFVGSEDGVFVSTDRGERWSRLNNNLPRTPVDDLEIHPRDNDLVAGTHGRGIWILDNISALSDLSEQASHEPAVLFPVVPATIFQYNVDVPSQGQGIFQASTPPFGAVLDYWLGQEVEVGIRVRIEDSGGSALRVLEGPGTVGFHRVVWDLRHQPVPHDTTVFDPPSLDVGPRGPLVMPGTYRARFTGLPQGGDDTEIEVRWDSLMPLPDSEIRARYDFTMELYELQQLGYHAQVQAGLTVDAAQEAVDSLRVLAGLTKDTPEEERPAHVTRADSLLEEIRSAASDLRGRNRDLRGWWRGLIGEFDGGPSTIGSLTGPNDSQLQRLAWTREAFADAVDVLDEVVSGVVPALNRVLVGEGVDPVEVPERGSGTG
jgi:photosystem II stability/assembly factor-like uncharacterized protein